MFSYARKKILSAIRCIDNSIYDNFGKIRVLFIIRNEFGLQCLQPILTACINDDQFSVKITIETETLSSFKFEDDQRSQELKSNFYTCPAVASFTKWHYVFTTDVTKMYFRRDTTVISTSHGPGYGNLPSGKEDYIDTMISDGRISLSFLNSKANLAEYISNEKYCSKNKQLLVTGFSRSDLLVNNSLSTVDKKTTLKELKLNPDFQTIVINSHWTENSLLKSLGAEFINYVCEAFPKHNVIVLGHQLLWKNHDGSERKSVLFDNLKHLEVKADNLTFIPCIDDMRDVLLTADLFIGDNSSFFIECCQVDTPFLYYESGMKFNSDQVYSIYKHASFSFSHCEELDCLINNALESPNLLRKERALAVEHFLYQPGHVTEYIISSLKEMGRVSGPSSKRWSNVVDHCRREMLTHIAPSKNGT